ncbi:ASCH domain-containing protein [Thermococcus sp.]
MEKEIVGVTFPVPKQFLDRILEEGKTVFVKPATLRAVPNMKIIFYASREYQGWYGEAEIESVEHFTSVEEIIRKYKDELFLTAKELREYEKERQRWHSRGKRRRPWMVVKLKNVRKYPNIIKPKRFITVSGRYVKGEEYREIARKADRGEK